MIENLSYEDLVSLGFKALPQSNTLRYPLGRCRFLSAMCIGQGNESIWICCEANGEISDLVCLHNRDFDGPLTLSRIISLLKWFATNSKLQMH